MNDVRWDLYRAMVLNKAPLRQSSEIAIRAVDIMNTIRSILSIEGISESTKLTLISSATAEINPKKTVDSQKP